MDVSVSIELGADKVAAGGILQGRLRLSCPEEISCRGVRLEVGYRAHGSGNEHTKMIHDGFLHQGGLPMRAELDLPFAVPIPADGPITYHGTHINVDWFVPARIDIPIFADRRFSQQFVVVPRQEDD